MSMRYLDPLRFDHALDARAILERVAADMESGPETPGAARRERHELFGCIYLHYPDGTRIIEVAAGRDLLWATMCAYDLWEESGEKVRVRVVRFLDDGAAMGICHLPPREGP